MSAVSTYFRLLNNTTENALFFDVEYEIAASYCNFRIGFYSSI